MLFILICRDKPGLLETRLANRPAHLDHLKGMVADGTIKFAGPFLDDDGKPNGSLLCVEAADRAAAAAIVEGDPYAKAGLFASVEVQPWNWTVNKPGAA